jgi:riboflavin synthase
MFTGIIKSKGVVIAFAKNVLEIEAEKNIFAGLELGASISVNGACLTITKIDGNKASFDVMDETINLSNLKNIKANSVVNLEPAMKLGDSIDGHMVQGHVDTTSEILNVKKEESQTILRISLPENFRKYSALKGSITVNGVSLTISMLEREYFEVSLVKHTLENTNLGLLEKGSIVNLEFDQMAKYLESLLDKREEESKYQYLVDRGFI